MSDAMNDLLAAVTVLQANVSVLTERIARLEERGKSDPLRVIDFESAQRERSPIEDPLDAYARSLHETLKHSRMQNNSPYGIGLTTLVAQSSKKGSMGTAYSIIQIDKPEDLPDDAKLLARMTSFATLLADPLIPRIFRAFLKLRFEGRTPQATSAALAEELGSSPEQIDALLKPLVESNTLQRGLSADGVPFYEWEGNSHRIMVLLFQD